MPALDVGELMSDNVFQFFIIHRFHGRRMKHYALLAKGTCCERIERRVLSDIDFRLNHAKASRCFLGDCVDVRELRFRYYGGPADKLALLYLDENDHANDNQRKNTDGKCRNEKQDTCEKAKSPI